MNADSPCGKCVFEEEHDERKCTLCEQVSCSAPADGWVYLDELSPELNELLANTPTLTDADIEELAEANRRLNLPWWKRLFKKPNDLK